MGHSILFDRFLQMAVSDPYPPGAALPWAAVMQRLRLVVAFCLSTSPGQYRETATDGYWTVADAFAIDIPGALCTTAAAPNVSQPPVAPIADPENRLA